MARKPKKRNSKLFYECKICFAIFDTPEELDLHYELSHSEPGDTVYLDGDDYYYY